MNRKNIDEFFFARPQRGFTLLEMSVVLIIIALLIAGIFVGSTLIRSSAVRGQIAQIERYNSAAHAFEQKYEYLPGDLLLGAANQYGFITTSCDGLSVGNRNGDGVLDGGVSPNTLWQGMGETELFWTDLSTAGLIDMTLPNNGATAPSCSNSTIPAMSNAAGTVSQYLPNGKIEYKTSIYVYEYKEINWFGLSGNIAFTSQKGGISSQGTLPVTVAYAIDKKIDDGLPTSGTVQATYLTGNYTSAAVTYSTNAATDNTSTCYNSSTNIYSLAVSKGELANCALSFQFK